MTGDRVERTKGPLEPEDAWYDDEGDVIVTRDDRFHGYAGRMMELVESLAAWGDPALWQYNLDLLREAIDHEQIYVDREKRLAARATVVDPGTSTTDERNPMDVILESLIPDGDDPNEDISEPWL